MLFYTFLIVATFIYIALDGSPFTNKDGLVYDITEIGLAIVNLIIAITFLGYAIRPIGIKLNHTKIKLVKVLCLFNLNFI